MLELTPENVLGYLRGRGWVSEGPVRVEPLSWGVSNAVFRVETPERAFVLKQSRERLRTRDLWISDLERIFREQEVMDVLGPLLPEETVPRVLFTDRENFLFAMSHAPDGARVWKEALLAGEVDVRVAERAGRILGLIHEQTARQPEKIEAFRDATVFVQLRVDPFYRRIQERRPELSDAVEGLVGRMLSVKEALCHGDYSPKNILTHGRGFTLVDYETAHFGDPTMDLGFFLSHLLLKSLRRCEERERFFELTRAFWRAYAGEVRFRSIQELRERGIAHLAVCLLARIDGTSPVDYLPEEPRREAVCRVGRRLLLEPPGDWNDVLAWCESEWSSVQPRASGERSPEARG
jgi:5-methylthioribose kinase